MNTKTMEGIVGARTNMNLVNTPMRVYKEARLRGDTAVMEKAMGYAGEFADKAEDYKVKADKGMEEDAKEAREKAKAECEKAIRKRREEREKLEERINENRKEDTLEVSQEGKVLLKGSTDSENSDTAKRDAAKEPVTYTKTGEVSHTEQSANISISV